MGEFILLEGINDLVLIALLVVAVCYRVGVKHMSSIFDANVRMQHLPESVVQRFKFTEQESVLCLGLVQGKTLDDIAEESRISRSILRNLFECLLRKTGADNEAKLVSRILSTQTMVAS